MHVLTQAGAPPGQSRRDSVALFCVMRNERKLVAHFFAHYRGLGVRDFYIVDNGSTDGTFEWLSDQKDINLFRTRARFSEANCGTDWINALIDEYGIGRWCLHVDADEMFTYRGCESVPIAAYAQALDAEGAQGVFGFMLDFYPRGSLQNGVLSDERSLAQVCALFDRDYVFRKSPRKPWASVRFPSLEVLGGPRIRLWSQLDREARTTWVDYFLRGQVDRVVEWVPDVLFPSFVKYCERQPPHLQKVPFVKPMDATFRYYMNAHSCTPVQLARENAVLCHFKFTADFYRRVVEETSRSEHYRRGSQYIRYKQLIVEGGREDLSYAGSIEFRNSEQLVELGLIRNLTDVFVQG